MKTWENKKNRGQINGSVPTKTLLPRAYTLLSDLTKPVKYPVSYPVLYFDTRIISYLEAFHTNLGHFVPRYEGYQRFEWFIQSGYEMTYSNRCQ